MTNKNDLKMAVIAGAAAALEYKEKNPKALNAEVMRQVTENAEKIAEKIDVEEI